MSIWTKDVTKLFSKEDAKAAGDDPKSVVAKKRRNPNRKRVARPGCRTPIATYDRVKFSVGLVAIFAFLMLSQISRSPLITTDEAFRLTYQDNTWIPVLLVAEITRQLHYFLGERLRGYWAGWLGLTKGLRAPAKRLRTDTRHRLGRIGNIALGMVLIGLVLAKLTGASNPISGWMNGLAKFWSSMPVILQASVYLVFAVLQFVAIFWFMSKGGVETVMPDDVKTNFSMVWGQDQVVDKVRETIRLLEDPDAIEAKGGYVPGGILLWGPPGTGKTLIAEAMAGETGKPFVMIEPGAFQAMFFGVNILKVKALYRRLRKLALRYGGVVAFFDEADVLGKRALSGTAPRGFRASAHTGASCSSVEMLSPAGQLVATGRVGTDGNPQDLNVPTTNSIIMPTGGGGDLGTLNAILASMQGLSKPRGLANRLRRVLGMRPTDPPKYRILHVMATNAPDALDAALLRPGRIDRIFRVGYPSKEGRIRTLEGYLAKVKHNLTHDDIVRLATSSPYSSGAVIKDVVNEALMAAIRDDREVVEWRDVIAAKSLKEHGATDGFEYIDQERHAVSIHEACHAVTAYLLKKDFAIDVATIERRGDIGGFVSRVPIVERMFSWRSEVEHDIQVAIASLVGERMFFEGDNTNGVSSDLETATRLALVMESRWGMGTTLASYDVLLEGGAGGPGAGTDGRGGAKNDGENSNERGNSPIIGNRVEQRLAELYDRTERLIAENRHQVLSLAHALEVHRTLNGVDVEAVIRGTIGPIVDGSVYATAEAQRRLEEYHTAATSVHRSGVGEALLPDLTTPGASGTVVPRSDDFWGPWPLDRGATDGTPGDGKPDA
jgi:cell division protease FtsH